jgi:thiosulfate reductase cytochrome b subunit
MAEKARGATMSEPLESVVKVHPVIVRVMHWVNAAAIIIMIGSGWHIYNNHPVFEWITFPRWATLGGDPEITYRLNKDVGFSNALLWHFAAMWVFFLNGTLALIYGFASGRIPHKWFPITVGGFFRDIADALTFRLSHDDLSVYNVVQRVSYVGVVLAALLVFVSGVAIWKPVQFQWLTALFIDFQGARLVHFLGMAAIVAFLVIHVTLALLVPKTIKAMLTGSISVKRKDLAAMTAAGE